MSLSEPSAVVIITELTDIWVLAYSPAIGAAPFLIELTSSSVATASSSGKTDCLVNSLLTMFRSLSHSLSIGIFHILSENKMCTFPVLPLSWWCIDISLAITNSDVSVCNQWYFYARNEKYVITDHIETNVIQYTRMLVYTTRFRAQGLKPNGKELGERSYWCLGVRWDFMVNYNIILNNDCCPGMCVPADEYKSTKQQAHTIPTRQWVHYLVIRHSTVIVTFNCKVCVGDEVELYLSIHSTHTKCGTELDWVVNHCEPLETNPDPVVFIWI